MKHKLITLLALFFFSGSQLSAATPPSDPLIKVKYGVYIKRISPNFKDQTFTAEFFWWMIYKNDTALTGVSDEEVMNFEYVNGINNTPGTIAGEIFERKDLSPNEHYFWGFHQGDFHFNPDYRKYPFDVQALEIIIENSVLEVDQLVFEPDTASFIASKQEKPRWMLSLEMLKNKNLGYRFFKTDIFSGSESYQTNFGDPTIPPVTDYGRITVVTYINRSIAPFFSKLIFPIIVILLLVYFVFFLPPEKIDIAAGLTVTSLLSSIAFQSSISAGLPEIGYVIFVDKLFFICYGLIVICMGESLVTYFMDRTGIPSMVKKAKQIDFYSRIVFPIVFIGLVLIVLRT